MLPRDLAGGTGTHRGVAEKKSWNCLKCCDRRIAAEGIPEGFRSAKPGRVILGGGEQRRHVSARCPFPARIIHEGFYCTRRYAAATRLTAGELAAQSVNILFKYASFLAAPRARLVWRLGGFVTNPVNNAG